MNAQEYAMSGLETSSRPTRGLIFREHAAICGRRRLKLKGAVDAPGVAKAGSTGLQKQPNAGPAGQGECR